MRVIPRMRGVWLVVVCLTLLGLAGCSGAAQNRAAARFYPPLPNKPRLQFLASYSSAADVESSSAVEDFLVGKDATVAMLRKPNCAVVVKDRIIVGDTGAHALFVFDLKKGEFRPMRGDDAAGKVKAPLQITVAQDGTVYVADGGRGQVLAYDNEENFLQAYGAENEVKPAGVAVYGDSLYVCDRDRHQVVVFDRRTGLVMRRIGAEGNTPGKFYIPTSIAVGPDGDLYVSEVGNFRVQRLRTDGTSVRMFGGLGDTPGTFTRPRGLAVGPKGEVYVVDAAFENVQVFDEAARLLLFFGGSGNAQGEFVLPSGLSISTAALEHFGKLADPNLKLEYLVAVVSQYGPNRISIFGYGDWKGAYQEPKAAAPKPAEPKPAEPPVAPKAPESKEGSPAPAAPAGKPAAPPAKGAPDAKTAPAKPAAVPAPAKRSAADGHSAKGATP